MAIEDREDLEFIKRFSKIKISKACKHFKYDQANLINGRLSKEKEKNVRKYIENKVANIYVNESDNYVKDNTL